MSVPHPPTPRQIQILFLCKKILESSIGHEAQAFCDILCFFEAPPPILFFFAQRHAHFESPNKQACPSENHLIFLIFEGKKFSFDRNFEWKDLKLRFGSNTSWDLNSAYGRSEDQRTDR